MPTPNEIAAKWQAKLNEFDGFIIVTAEYNRSIPGALKNAIDWAYKPFMKKAVAYMSYGSVGGARAVEHLRTIMVELQAVSVRHGLHIGGSEFGPIMMGQKTWDDVLPRQVPFTKDVFDNLLWWTNATKAARAADAGRRQGGLSPTITLGIFSFCPRTEGGAAGAALCFSCAERTDRRRRILASSIPANLSQSTPVECDCRRV